jgi:hypothetical protein
MKLEFRSNGKFFLIFTALFFCGVLSFAQSSGSGGSGAGDAGAAPPASEEFHQVLSLDWNLERLSSSVSSGRVQQIPKDKYLLIEGIVSTRQVVQGEEENYFAILELSSGKWDEGQQLSMYRCYFRLEGPQFYGLVPTGRGSSGSDGENSQEIPLHAHVLAIGTYLGYGQDNQGNRFPVLKALEVRRLNQ